MALINCPECGKQVSDKAVSCPNCGFGVAEKDKPDTEQKESADAGAVEQESQTKKENSNQVKSIRRIPFGAKLAIVVCLVWGFFIAGKVIMQNQQNKERIETMKTELQEYENSKTGEATEYGILLMGEFEMGMQEGQIKKGMGKDGISNGNIVYFTQSKTINDKFKLNAKSFGFTDDNKLIYIDNTIDQRYDTLSLEGSIFEEYEKIVAFISEYFSEPVKNDFIWYDEKYKDDRLMWNDAFEKGHCIAFTTWETDTLFIVAVLEGVSISVSYSNITHLDAIFPEDNLELYR